MKKQYQANKKQDTTKASALDISADKQNKINTTPPPPPHGRQDMALKTHTGQANTNIKAQENTLSAKPLSPFKVPLSIFKYIGKRYSWINPNKANTQSQTVGLSKAKQTQTKEPTLIPSRRQFIEQYGAYALVTPVALYAMMSPNRAMAQASSAGVVDRRPRSIVAGSTIMHTPGYLSKNVELLLERNQKYIAPDGASYICASDYCFISPILPGLAGVKVLNGSFDSNGRFMIFL